MILPFELNGNHDSLLENFRYLKFGNSKSTHPYPVIMKHVCIYIYIISINIYIYNLILSITKYLPHFSE